MTAYDLTPPQSLWKCPSCDLVEQAAVAIGQARMHPCPALRGLNIPLEQVSDEDARTVSRHRVIVSEDYGTPAVSVSTDRPDGSNDLNVYPQAALAVMNS